MGIRTKQEAREAIEILMRQCDIIGDNIEYEDVKTNQKRLTDLLYKILEVLKP